MTENSIDREPQLTREAKEAIRSYVIKLVLPSAVVWSIFVAVGGYFFGALTTVSEKVSEIERLQPLYDEAAKAGAAVQAASSATESARSKAEDAERYILTVKSSVDDILTGEFTTFAKKLVDDPAFRSKLATVSNEGLAEVSDEIVKARGANNWTAETALSGYNTGCEYKLVTTSGEMMYPITVSPDTLTALKAEHGGFSIGTVRVGNSFLYFAGADIQSPVQVYKRCLQIEVAPVQK